MIPQPSGRSAAAAPEWGRYAADVVGHLDDDDLPQALVKFLGSLLSFEAAIVFVNRRNYPPLHLFDTMKTPRAKRGVMNYARSTYLLNPFYNAFLRGITGGVYRIGEVAPAAAVKRAHFHNRHIRVTALEEIGYLTKDWPPGRAEVLVALDLPEGEMGEISLIQPVRIGGFSETDLQALSAAQPFLEAAFARYWRRVRPRYNKRQAATVTAAPSSQLRRHGLSIREREVAYLILKGHSTPSISLQLGISVTTVKTHRKNLYAKLGIATHYELFAMFLESFDHPTNASLDQAIGPIGSSSSFGRMGSGGRPG